MKNMIQVSASRELLRHIKHKQKKKLQQNGPNNSKVLKLIQI